MSFKFEMPFRLSLSDRPSFLSASLQSLRAHTYRLERDGSIKTLALPTESAEGGSIETSPHPARPCGPFGPFDWLFISPTVFLHVSPSSTRHSPLSREAFTQQIKQFFFIFFFVLLSKKKKIDRPSPPSASGPVQ